MNPTPDLRADTVVARMARQLDDGAVVATGVASPLAILAIAVARATHAPRLTYLACVGAMDPMIEHLHRSSEDLAYLRGRRGDVSITDLFDHARRGRIDTVFFGAAEVDGLGRTNMSAAGSLARPTAKFPGVAGAASLRRWVKRPVLVVPRQSRRSLVPAVQVVSTADTARRMQVITDLGVFEVGHPEAVLVALHPWATVDEVAAKTGFSFTVDRTVETTPIPDESTRAAIRAIDSDNRRASLIG